MQPVSNQVVVGMGEVGTALQTILKCDAHDPAKGFNCEGHFDFVHVAIPYHNENQFSQAVAEIREKFTPALIINHSSVPVGTSRKLDLVHSPIRGVHPHLERGIRTFVKYFGAIDRNVAEVAGSLFTPHGIKVKIANNPEETEAAKLWCTTGYGLNIILQKVIHKYCLDKKLDFNLVYTDFISSYNKGYAELGMPQFCKYNLKYMDGKIGGHCILPNCELLDSWLADFVADQNDLL